MVWTCLECFGRSAVLENLCQESLGRPRGSFIMASQTRAALEMVACTTMAICCTKEAVWDPWCHGHQRISEMSASQGNGRYNALH